ncbi:putative extracellular glycosidase [Lachnellula subtilissima]|uniref:chitinase n=1 Tax=Lachnellula subtilissima TaxID=602034 RepID=A0A8H8RCM4_9HELO|nr:putative extracellular glycosidase [Lachnellula subtilissima]
MRFITFLLGAAALLTSVAGQTSTLCNPLNATCTLNYTPDGAEFTVAKRLDSPTIQSKFNIMFGSVSVVMKAATGTGIVSSIVLESDDLDEIDWEFMGGNSTHAETNYFGKGNTTAYDRAIYYPVSSDVRANFHNYTVDWTADKLDWLIDSTVVRTLHYADANQGRTYPQTPMTVRLGIWAGGDSSLNKYTIEWAGGETDYSKGPYNMYVQSAEIKDYSSGSAYEWTDNTGSWQSIKSLPPPPFRPPKKFQALPQATKLAIYGGSGAAGAILLAALLFYYIRQRRAGALERETYNAKIEKEREEAYMDQMELKEKGYGGWNNAEVAHQGEDALGGWGTTHGNNPPTIPSTPKFPNVSSNEINPASRNYGDSQNVPQSPGFHLPSAYNSGGYQRFG